MNTPASGETSSSFTKSADTVFVNFRVASMCESNTPYGALGDVAIGVANGTIDFIVPRPEFESAQSSESSRADIVVIDGAGQWLTPGLIDCHTHLVHGGNRAGEWESRLGGVSYEEIARQGGGILSSVKATRAASEEELVASATRRLLSLIREGVTTVEIKSGYGLDIETEIKMLRAAIAVGVATGVSVSPTLLGAHAVAPEFKGRSDDYVTHVCQEMIPAARGLCTAVDAFCESIAFSVEQTKRVLQAGLDEGLAIKVHAEQLSDLGMAAEAAKMGAISADHLEYLADKDCETLAKHGTVATLLPGAFYCLNEKQKPPVASLINNGVPIAIATDCNPGSSPAVSLLLMGNMACNLFGLTPEQALAGVTRNAAQALRLDDRGMIQPGMKADFAVWDVASPGEIFYQIGGTPCVAIYKSGRPLSTQ